VSQQIAKAHTNRYAIVSHPDIVDAMNKLQASEKEPQISHSKTSSKKNNIPPTIN
jgi:hypothetical protein